MRNRKAVRISDIDWNSNQGPPISNPRILITTLQYPVKGIVTLCHLRLCTECRIRGWQCNLELMFWLSCFPFHSLENVMRDADQCRLESSTQVTSRISNNCVHLCLQGSAADRVYDILHKQNFWKELSFTCFIQYCEASRWNNNWS
jgi:hypothetical protein